MDGSMGCPFSSLVQWLEREVRIECVLHYFWHFVAVVGLAVFFDDQQFFFALAPSWDPCEVGIKVGCRLPSIPEI